jgi:NDP-hexose-3-ketoreductase
VRFGVLGCADIACRQLIPALGRAGLPLVAVASRDPGKAARVAGRFGCQAVTGYRQLLDRPDIDAVYIPLPVSLHVPWAAAALLAGKHVLVEKSVTTDAVAARGLAALAEKAGLLLMEDFMFLRHSAHRTVAELIGVGEIGEPRMFEAWFGIPPTDPGGIRYAADLGGGALAEVGTYPVRAAQLYLGDALQVAGATLRHDPGCGVEVAGSALLRDSAGLTAHCGFGFEHAYRSRYAIWGSAGRLELDRAFTPPADHQPTLRLESGGRVSERVLAPDDQFRNILREFAADAGSAERRAVHRADIVRQATLLDAVRNSAANAPPGRPDRNGRKESRGQGSG